jgi:hypothetical protein
MPSKDAIFMSGTICPISLCGRSRMLISHICVDTIFLPSGRLMCMGFIAMQMLPAGAPAIMKIDVAPVLATACVGAIRIAFAWCSTALAQLEATIVTSLPSSAQCVEARQS